MNSFRDSIVYINDHYETADFPDRFSNEIYISELSSGINYAYNSPFSIKYTFNGEERYKKNGKRFTLEPGQILVVNDQSEMEVDEYRSKCSKNIGMSIFIDPQIIRDVFGVLRSPQQIAEYEQQVDLPVFFDDMIYYDQQLTPCIETIFHRFFFNKEAAVPEILFYQLCEWLMEFQFGFLKKIERLNKVKYATKKEIYQRVSLAKNIIEDSFDKKINLDFVARESALSKYFLIRSFKDIYNITPQQYRLKLRMIKAKDLLQKELPVSEIATALGFADVASFSKKFRLYFGCSPSAYKRSH